MPSTSRSSFAAELGALALVVLAAGGCLVDPRDADCDGATSCGDCLERSGCGWCAPRGRCVPGTSVGPADDFLDCESELEYIRSGWQYSSCASCAKIDTCGECQEEFCTWCADGAGYCVTASDDDACRAPQERRDGCIVVPGADGGPGGVDGGPGGGGCTNTCSYAGDGDCDDGGPGSDFSLCELGTDCTDCGPR